MKSGTSGKNTDAGALTGSGELSPLLRQFQQIKGQHPEHVLFFRCGDFYEMFFDDARTCSEVLGITLTSRGTDTRGEPVPLAGIPYHSVEGYLARMIRAGYRVAICEQTESPKTAKGVIRREVVRVVTPGTVLEDNLLDNKANNYLVALVEEKGALGLAALDFSTGQFAVTEFRGNHAAQECTAELVRLGPAELVVARDQREAIEALLDADADFNVHKAPIVAVVDPAAVSQWAARDALLVQMEVRDLNGFGAEGHPLAVRAAGAILAYLKETQRTALGHVNELRVYHPGESMVLDATTQRSLELVANLTDATRRHTVLEVLDRTATSMGARLLRSWLLQPLRDPARIDGRLDAVETFVRDGLLRSRALECLKAVNDLERIVSRSVCRTANGRDLLALRNSLQQVPRLCRLLGEAAGFEAGIRGGRIAEDSVAAASVTTFSTAGASGIAVGSSVGMGSVPASGGVATTVDPFDNDAQEAESEQDPDYSIHNDNPSPENPTDVEGVEGRGIQFQEEMRSGLQRQTQALTEELDNPTVMEDSDGAAPAPVPSLLGELLRQLNPLPDLTAALEAALVDQPPQSVREGGMIREGYDPRLDELRLLSSDSKSWIAQMRQQEIERTGISNLKIGFNRVFGYFIEVSHSHAAKVPSTYIRKQTLAGAERFVTAELKEKEEVILHAEERSQELEFEIFERLRDQACARAREIQATARAVAQMDVLQSLAQVAVSNRYCRPSFGKSSKDAVTEPVSNSEFRIQNSELFIRDGRHPVLE
ncbi:MAG: hypothetical protein H0U67_04065, partial [Gemmatimonadetes bacterium]|nr:hypothetical protein [Gemmatimonadota bacterium]